MCDILSMWVYEQVETHLFGQLITGHLLARERLRGVIIVKVHLNHSENDVASDGFIENAIECLH